MALRPFAWLGLEVAIVARGGGGAEMEATATDVVLVLRARPRLVQHEEHTDAAPEAQTTALGVERRHSSTGKQGPVHEALQGREGEHRVEQTRNGE